MYRETKSFKFLLHSLKTKFITIGIGIARQRTEIRSLVMVYDRPCKTMERLCRFYKPRPSTHRWIVVIYRAIIVNPGLARVARISSSSFLPCQKKLSSLTVQRPFLCSSYEIAVTIVRVLVLGRNFLCISARQTHLYFIACVVLHT